MPGSKRRALKKFLSPSPVASPVPIPVTPDQNLLNGHVVSSPPPIEQQNRSHSGGLSQSLSHSPFHLPHLRKSGSNSTPESNSLHPSSSMTSASSIASDPNNYLSDKELKDDLVLEEMRQREQVIGNGMHGAEHGVGHIVANPGNVRASNVPPPVGISTILNANLEDGSTVPPAPLVGVVNGQQGALHQPVPQVPLSGVPPPTSEQMDPEHLLYGNESSHVQGGQRKSSKQKFEERQVRPCFITHQAALLIHLRPTFLLLPVHITMVVHSSSVLLYRPGRKKHFWPQTLPQTQHGLRNSSVNDWRRSK